MKGEYKGYMDELFGSMTDPKLRAMWMLMRSVDSSADRKIVMKHILKRMKKISK